MNQNNATWCRPRHRRFDDSGASGCPRTLVSRTFLAAGVLLLLLGLLSPTGTLATTGSARSRAMGDVALSGRGYGDLTTNAAYGAFVGDAPYTVLLPIGLVQLATAPPTLDPGAPGFSGLELLDLALNPPVDWRLDGGRTAPAQPIQVQIAQDAVAIDLGEAQNWIPSTSGRWGGVHSTSVFAARARNVVISVAPVIANRARLDLSEGLERALADGETLASDGTYALDGNTELTAALSIGVHAARQIWGESPLTSDPARGWRVYAGGGCKYLMGLGYMQAIAEFDLVPSEPLLDPNDPMRMEFVSTVRSAAPGVTGGPGQGFALDIGLLATHGDRYQFGLSASNLAATMHWRTDVDRFWLNPTTGEIQAERLARGQSHRTTLPAVWNLSAARTWGGRTTLATDLRHDPTGVSWRLGTEQWVGPLAARAGLVFGAHGLPRWSAGTGMQFGRVGLDLAVYSSDASLDDNRALMLGTSLTIHPRSALSSSAGAHDSED